MSQPQLSASLCPDCGAAIRPDTAACWLCRRPLVITAELVEGGTPPKSAFVAANRANPALFSLETLMLVITLIAVCLGVIMAAPGLGVVVALVAGPALVRSLVAGYQERQAGTPMTLGDKLLTFVASTGVSLAVLVTGWTAFAAACMGSCFVAAGIDEFGGGAWFRVNGDSIFFVLFAVSGTIGLATAGWLFWVLRPRRK